MSIHGIPIGAVLPVSGISGHQLVASTVGHQDTVTLTHEVTHARDPWAVSVRTSNGDLLGFLPTRGQIGERLARSQPGGVWSAVVVEIVGGDVIGLRIRLGDLVSTHCTRPGSDMVGERRTGDTSTDHISTDPDAPTSSQEPSEGSSPVQVFTRSGRLVGTLIQDGDVVRVRAGDGSVRSYPRTVLDLPPLGGQVGVAGVRAPA